MRLKAKTICNEDRFIPITYIARRNAASRNGNYFAFMVGSINEICGFLPS